MGVLLLNTEITTLPGAMLSVAICLRLPSELCVNNYGTNEVTPPSSAPPSGKDK